MNRPNMDQARISEEMRAVATLDLNELREEWRRRWDEPPQFRSRDLLARALAYKLQAETAGDLSPSLRRRMGEFAKHFTKDRRYSPVPGHDLKPGTSLIREWRGVRHEVAVADAGFLYQGQEYRSLSQVAGHITGTKWNGHVFFGLKRRAA